MQKRASMPSVERQGRFIFLANRLLSAPPSVLYAEGHMQSGNGLNMFAMRSLFVFLQLNDYIKVFRDLPCTRCTQTAASMRSQYKCLVQNGSVPKIMRPFYMLQDRFNLSVFDVDLLNGPAGNERI